VLDWILARLEEEPEWPVPDIKIHASQSAGRDMMLRRKQEIDEKTVVRAMEKRKRA